MVICGMALGYADEAHPINPQRVFWELSPRLPDNCILTCDSGTSAAWYARDLKIRRGMINEDEFRKLVEVSRSGPVGREHLQAGGVQALHQRRTADDRQISARLGP